MIKAKINLQVVVLFILLLSFNYAKAQIEITGVVINDQITPIESANVLVYDDNENIIAYTYTKINGIYLLKIDANSRKYIKLSAASLGYQKKTDSIKVLPGIKQYNIDFKLQAKVEQLSEVVLQPDEKISKEGTKTTYKVKAFNKGAEQTVEDVLKNLPGIEILKNGTIKAHGRLIDKLLIEGEDMFDKNYTILSKNLDAKVLNEVEILDDFEDNPVLAKVIASEKVAINLVLKDEYKNIWFGNLNTGIGTKDRFKLASNIGLIRKKIKFFNFNNYNNLGTKAMEQLETSNNNNSGIFSEKTVEPNTTSIYNIPNNNNSIFNENKSTFNKALINSLSFVTSLKPNIKIRGTGYITNDIEKQLSKSITTFNTGETPITYTEENDTKFNNSIAGGELELKYTNNEKSYLKNTLIYDNKPKRTYNKLLFNRGITSETLKEQEFSIYNHLNYTHTLGKKNALHNYIYLGKNEIKQNAIINSASLNQIFFQPENSSINHSTKDDLTVFGIRSSTLVNFKKINSNIELGYESVNENKKNEFILLETGNNVQVDSLQNNLNFKQQNLYLKTNLKYKISKNIDLSAGLSLDYVKIDANLAKNNKLLLNPNIKFYLKNLKIGFISLGYRRSYNTPKSILFLENYQLNNYQSFKRGTNNIRFPIKDNFSLYYNIKNDLYTRALSVRIQYINSNGKYSSSNQIGQNILLSSAEFVDSGNILSSNINFTSYFQKLNLSTNLGVTQSFSNTPIQANTNSFKVLKTQSSYYFLSGRTYFKLPVNFEFKFNLRHTKSKFNSIKTNTTWKFLDLNATYKLSKTLITSLNNSFYLLKSGNYFFSNFKVDYTPETSRFSYQFLINNLGNEDLFSIDVIDEFSTYKSTTRLLPRYAFALIKYRF